jgi:hypothetical protein
VNHFNALVVVANDNHRATTHVGTKIVAALLDLALVSEIEPSHAKDVL